MSDSITKICKINYGDVYCTFMKLYDTIKNNTMMGTTFINIKNNDYMINIHMEGFWDVYYNDIKTSPKNDGKNKIIINDYKNCLDEFFNIIRKKNDLVNVLQINGKSHCRTCGIENGSYEYEFYDEETETFFIFPEGLKHYIIEHDLIVSDAFQKVAEKVYKLLNENNLQSRITKIINKPFATDIIDMIQRVDLNKKIKYDMITEQKETKFSNIIEIKYDPTDYIRVSMETYDTELSICGYTNDIIKNMCVKFEFDEIYKCPPNHVTSYNFINKIDMFTFAGTYVSSLNNEFKLIDDNRNNIYYDDLQDNVRYLRYKLPNNFSTIIHYDNDQLRPMFFPVGEAGLIIKIYINEDVIKQIEKYNNKKLIIKNVIVEVDIIKIRHRIHLSGEFYTLKKFSFLDERRKAIIGAAKKQYSDFKY